MKAWHVAVCAVLLAGCAQTPIPTQPAMPLSSSFKEVQHSASPESAGARQIELTWWHMLGDSDLDQLEQQLLSNSPDLASALARYEQARASTAVIRAAQSPMIGASLDLQRERQSARRPTRSSNAVSQFNSATFSLDLQYEVDLWGRVRQQVQAGIARENAARADLAAARLSLQAQLADTFIQLRGTDAELDLLRETERAYVRAMELIEHRHAMGAGSGLELAQAQVQAETVRSQVRQLQGQRAMLEHAVAALAGADPSTFSIVPKGATGPMAAVPTGVPADLLRRRPDIVAAEKRVTAAAANAGVARTAFFPSLTLGASAGIQSDQFAQLLSLPGRFWAVGPAIAGAVFDGGRRKAVVAGADAALDEAGQQYRGHVLGAIQEVEDQLAMLRELGAASNAERQAASAAHRAQQLASERYRLGAASYLEVVTSQTADLQASRNVVGLDTRQKRASIGLIRALGGGWLAE